MPAPGRGTAGSDERSPLYLDDRACRVCGSEVRLEARTASSLPDDDGPVGPEDGVVGGGDPTVDARICTNPDCPSNRSGADAEDAEDVEV